MIIVIIGILITLVCVSGAIVAYNKQEEGVFYVFIFLSLFFGLFAVGESIACVCVNCDYNCRAMRLSYEQEVESLTSTKEYIITLTDDYARSVAVQQYNSEVKEFKERIKLRQLSLNNPWTSWFNCREFKNFDANIVSYL